MTMASRRSGSGNWAGWPSGLELTWHSLKAPGSPADDRDVESGYIDPAEIARAVSALSDGVVLTDPWLSDHPIVWANDAFCELTGYRRDEVVGRNCRFLQGPLTDVGAVARIRAAIAAREHFHESSTTARMAPPS